MNTKISYLYRDADNYKRYNECIVAGTLSANQICTILDCCDMGEYFIPGQVGLPERRFDPYDPQADRKGRVSIWISSMDCLSRQSTASRKR